MLQAWGPFVSVISPVTLREECGEEALRGKS